MTQLGLCDLFRNLGETWGEIFVCESWARSCYLEVAQVPRVFQVPRIWRYTRTVVDACRCIYLEERHPGTQTHVSAVWSMITVIVEASQTCSQKWVRQFALPCHTAPWRSIERIPPPFLPLLTRSLVPISPHVIMNRWTWTVEGKGILFNAIDRLFNKIPIARCISDVTFGSSFTPEPKVPVWRVT